MYFGFNPAYGFGFYEVDFDGAVKLSQEEYLKLLDEQSTGRQIVLVDGKVFTCEYGLYREEGDKFIRKSDEEFLNEKTAIQNQLRIELIDSQLRDIDEKRIRAMCEPELYNIETGETWLEFYNNQAIALRKEREILTGEYE